MQPSDIIDVSEADFEYQVIAYSQQVPVVVDFWADWCVPCRVLGPILEKLAEEGEGSFRLAKVNVDENPNLARRFRVTGIPAVKAFRNGQVVAEFHGAQPEPRVREFLRLVVPSTADLNLEKGWSLLLAGQPEEAEEAFRQVLDEEPDRSPALLGLCKALLLQGEAEEALYTLENFPASREYSAAQNLLPLARAMIQVRHEAPEDFENFLDSAYHRAINLVMRGNLEAAMDGLLDILRQDKRYRKGEAHQVMLALLELLGEGHPSARQYRSELASVLF
ncbi:MAG: tetratricopeptide repeat protein [Chloroflexi bacterium]|jgi:putative thioredoxin|nr:tetratricopeptide repeat protein [Chloroflexota bacterium]